MKPIKTPGSKLYQEYVKRKKKHAVKPNNCLLSEGPEKKLLADEHHFQ